MAHKRHFVLHINGQDFDVYSDVLPLGLHTVSITLRRTKRPQRHVGPNYDGSYNSIRAALLYTRVHPTARWLVWKHLYDRRGTWVPGDELMAYGTAALERVRELRHAFGWPIEAQSPPQGIGVWHYRLILPRPRLIKIGTP